MVGTETRFTDAISLDVQLYYKDLFDQVRATLGETSGGGRTSTRSDLRYTSTGHGRSLRRGAAAAARAHQELLRVDRVLALALRARLLRAAPVYGLSQYDQPHNLIVVASYKLPFDFIVGAKLRYTSGPLTRPVVAHLRRERQLLLPHSGLSSTRGACPTSSSSTCASTSASSSSDWMLAVYLDVQNVDEPDERRGGDQQLRLLAAGVLDRPADSPRARAEGGVLMLQDSKTLFLSPPGERVGERGKPLLLLALLLTACDPGFRPETLVENLRLIGISADHPKLHPGETARISSLVLDPPRTSPSTVLWLGCEADPYNLNRSPCANPDVLQDPSTLTNGTGTLPPGVTVIGFNDQRRLHSPRRTRSTCSRPTIRAGRRAPSGRSSRSRSRRPSSPQASMEELQALFERVQRKEAEVRPRALPGAHLGVDRCATRTRSSTRWWWPTSRGRRAPASSCSENEPITLDVHRARVELRAVRAGDADRRRAEDRAHPHRVVLDLAAASARPAPRWAKG